MPRTPLADLLRQAITLHKAQPEAAEPLYRAILARAPAQPDANLLLAELLYKSERPQEALPLATAAHRTRPNDPDLLNLLASIEGELGHHEAAIARFDTALALRPNSPELLRNRANTLMDAGRLPEALAGLDAALAQAPNDEDAQLSRGIALRALGRPREALIDLARAAALSPASLDAAWNETGCRLLLGDFERGWRGYERRWQLPDLGTEPPDTTAPLWLGAEPLAGRTILLHAEQGLGDTLQFCRYVPMVAAAGGRVVLQAPPILHPLLAALPGVEHLVARGEPRPPEALQTPLLSLPLAFRTRLETIPAQVPYLQAPAARVQRWRDALPCGERPQARLRVGVVWAGNRQFRRDADRSIALARFARLFAAPCDFVVLQTELADPDAALLADHPNVRLLDAPRDFADTAAVIGLLDLVVSVDTAVAHLAGALAAPVWLLLPLSPDWRWLTERTDTPWYPTMRLFRQAVANEWDAVLERVAIRLEEGKKALLF